MRLFLIEWSGRDFGLIDVVAALRQRSHQIVYWSGHGIESEVDVGQFPGTIFHDHFDALTGKPAKGVDCADFLPPGEELISQLYQTESVILTMMNKKYEWMCVDERRHFYYHLLAYWHGVMKKYQPEAIIFPAIPHTVYDFLIYSLAQLFHIKIIILETTWVNDRLLLMNNFQTGSAALAVELEQNKFKTFSIADFSGAIQDYYKLQTGQSGDATPFYVRKFFNSYSVINLLWLKLKMVARSIQDLTLFNKIIEFFSKRLTKNLKKEYLSVQSAVNFNAKFIYLPLHYQPERTTSPQGDIFVDQILMIEILSSSLPNGWLIYVKEHPTQWLPRGLRFFNYRYENYYKEIAKLKNVRLIPIESDTYTLINKAQAVATVTGTAGWEALLRGKPALIFGYPWYQQCPGLFKIQDTVSAKEAIEKIAAGFRPDSQQIINYLASFDKVSFSGYLEAYGREITKIDEEKNKSNISNALIRAIEGSSI